MQIPNLSTDKLEIPKRYDSEYCATETTYSKFASNFFFLGGAGEHKGLPVRTLCLDSAPSTPVLFQSRICILGPIMGCTVALRYDLMWRSRLYPWNKWRDTHRLDTYMIWSCVSLCRSIYNNNNKTWTETMKRYKPGTVHKETETQSGSFPWDACQIEPASISWLGPGWLGKCFWVNCCTEVGEEGRPDSSWGEIDLASLLEEQNSTQIRRPITFWRVPNLPCQ